MYLFMGYIIYTKYSQKLSPWDRYSILRTLRFLFGLLELPSYVHFHFKTVDKISSVKHK